MVALEILLIAIMAGVAASSVAIVVRRIASGGKWVGGYGGSASDSSHRQGT